jgi:pilus assembly protein CpaB
MKGFVLLGCAVVMAALTGLLVYNWLERQQMALEPAPLLAPRTTMVAVAAVDLFWGTKLTPEMIKLVPFQPGSIPRDAFTDKETLLGRVLVTNVTMHEPLLGAKLAPIDVTEGGVAAVTTPEKRAIAIKVDDVVGVAGFINPGNRVDVLVTLPQKPPVTKTVLQNVLVLATGTEIERRGKETTPHPVKVVTVEVTPEEGELLGLAANEGKLQLTLRNHLNTKPVLTKGATINSLLNAYRLPGRSARPKSGKAVARRRASSSQVEVITGGTIKTYTFKES